jgi:hypothetical protein
VWSRRVAPIQAGLEHLLMFMHEQKIDMLIAVEFLKEMPRTSVING